MNKIRSKTGAIELSFGMIFSIILIVVFLAAGFYAISKFIAFQRTIQIGIFITDFGNNVETLWKRNQGSQDLVYSLPPTINAVCFKNDEFENLYFQSKGIVDGKMIQHIDIAKTTKDEDPLCIPNLKGKVTIRLSKEMGEALVTVTR